MVSDPSTPTLDALAAVLLPLTVAAAQAASPEAPAVAQAAQAGARAEVQRALAVRVQTPHVAGACGLGIADLRSPGDRPCDHTGTRLKEPAREATSRRQFAALAAGRVGAWHIVESRIGATDVAWDGWAERHHAPPPCSRCGEWQRGA